MAEKLNAMCFDCQHLGKLCDGTHKDFYSGCIWKEADPASLERFRQETAGTIEGAEK